MTGTRSPPQEIFYALEVSTFETQRLKPLISAKITAQAWLRRAFPRKGLTYTFTGGSRQTYQAAGGVIDHSGITALLRQVEGLKSAEQARNETYVQGNPRDPQFNYKTRITAQLWLGTAAQLAARPEIADWHLRDGDINTANICAALKKFNSPETAKAGQDAIDTAVARATETPDKIKPMKVLKLKGPGA